MHLPTARLVALGINAAIIIAMTWFLYFTLAGKAVRAAIMNRDAIQIVGIDVHRLSACAFGLATALAAHLGVNYQEILENRVFSLVSADELKAMVAGRLDVELHTHRHDFPLDRDSARREIEDNRAVIEPFVGRPLRHFCYPSGLWSEEHWPVLRELGIETATTIEPGLVRANSPRLALDRILDSEEVSQIEFEAEIYGFSEIVRRLRRRLAGATRGLPGEVDVRRQEA